REGAWLSGLLNRLDAQEPSIDDSLASIPRFISEDESIFGPDESLTNGRPPVAGRRGAAIGGSRVHQLSLVHAVAAEPMVMRSRVTRSLAAKRWVWGRVSSRTYPSDSIQMVRLKHSSSRAG